MSGPLNGTTIIEFAGLGPAPYCGMLLADLGADVIRVDRPGGGGLASAPDQVLQRGKRSIVLDLKSADGLDVALRLCDRADALIEGFRPGVAERLGLGPEEVLSRNPNLVYGRMTGWGQDGPLASTAGHDIDYLAVSGALHPIGTEDKPIPPLNIAADFGGGAMFLAVGVLAGILHARAGGGGQVVDAAMVDGAAHLTTMFHGLMAVGNVEHRPPVEPARRGSALLRHLRDRRRPPRGGGCSGTTVLFRADRAPRPLRGWSARPVRPCRVGAPPDPARPGVSNQDPRRVGRCVRGIRCLCGAGHEPRRGTSPPAQHGAWRCSWRWAG
jgi:crotonobetainyl-CoA:carnitine CoA-transferase CaiB-like acyl-CoA transferase